MLLMYAVIPAVVMVMAGVWAVLRPPNEQWRSAIMHFAAGVVFAVVAVELLPELVHERSVPATVTGFALGTAAMLGVRAWSERSLRNPSQTGGAAWWQQRQWISSSMV